MNAELLNLLSPEERAAWALCEGATPGPWVDMTSAGPDVGAFDGEIRAALSFTHICSDVPGDDRENDRAFIAGSRDALPLALTTIATLRADLAEVQARYGRAWEALCTIGDAVDKAGHYTLIPERALHVGNAVNALIAEAEALRAENTTLRETLAEQQRAFVIGLDLAQRTAFTEADPVPARRNCRSCTHATGDHLGRPMCGVEEGEYDVAEWRADLANVDDDGHCRPDADNCPGYTLRESAARITANSP